MPNEILEALESAADADNSRLSSGHDNCGAVSGARRVNSLRAAIKRFIEELPDEMTVREIREGMEPDPAEPAA